jgi:hypothetical protein
MTSRRRYRLWRALRRWLAGLRLALHVMLHRGPLVGYRVRSV